MLNYLIKFEAAFITFCSLHVKEVEGYYMYILTRQPFHGRKPGLLCDGIFVFF